MFRSSLACAFLAIVVPLGIAQEPPSESIRIVPVEPASQESVEALRLPVRLDVKDAPLEEVTRQIAEQIGVPIAIDERSLGRLGLTGREPVSGTFREITARSALQILLRDLDLAYQAREGFIRVMTYEDAERSLATRIYRFEMEVTPADLVQVIQMATAPDTWEILGGPSTISALPQTLVVTTIDPVHEEVAALLKALSKVANSAQRVENVFNVDRLDPANQRVRAALDQPSGVAAGTYSLAGLTADLQEQADINVRLDLRSLDEMGMTAESQVTVPANGLSIRRLLEQIDSRHLSYQARWGVLLITTREAAEAELATAVFDVRDLVIDADSTSSATVGISGTAVGQAPPVRGAANVLGQIQPSIGGGMCGSFYRAPPAARPWSVNALSEVIQSTLEPEIWEALGGPAAIAPVADLQCLVVQAPAGTLAQVGQLLDGLREVGGPVAEDSDAERLPEGYTRRILQAPAEQQQLAVAIKQLVAPGTWNESDVYLIFVGPRLIVQHRNEVVTQVERLVRELNLPSQGQSDGLPNPYSGGGASGANEPQ